MPFHTKYAQMFAFALAVSWPPLASTAEPLPSYITGTWGMDKTPNIDGSRRVDMVLEANGFGALIGSTTQADNMNGSDAEKSVPQSFISMPIKATLQGDILTTRPSDPSGKYAEDADHMTLACHYDATGPTLRCADRHGVVIDLQRRSETIAAEVAKMLAVVRSQTSGR